MLLSLSCGALQACTSSSNSDVSGPISVKIPWYSPQGYGPQVVNLNTVQDRKSFHGTAARFYISPMIENNRLSGDKPQVNLMKTSEGFYVPQDYMSSQIVTLYAHFEKLQDVDRSLALDKTLPGWPKTQDVGVAVHEYDADGNWLSNNASFVSGLDSFLFLPYSLGHLPFTINPGIVAHEYFHALFNQIMIKPSGLNYPGWKEPTGHEDSKILKTFALNKDLVPFTAADDTKDPARDYYHEYLLRGINEGMADVWGWLYSQDPEFISVTAEKQLDRSLKAAPLEMVSKQQIKQRATFSKGLDAGVYYIGTLYARRIFKTYQDELAQGKFSEVDLQKSLRQALLESIKDLQTSYSSLAADEYLDPQDMLKFINGQLKTQKWTQSVK